MRLRIIKIHGDVSGIPERLKFLRKEKGITQRQFASMVGCSFTMVESLETGRCGPSDEMLKRIAETFDVSIEWLLTGNKNSEEDVKEELRVINDCRLSSKIDPLGVRTKTWT